MKYILQDNRSTTQWKEAGKRLIEAIIKTSNAAGSNQALTSQNRPQRTQIHSTIYTIDDHSVRDIFIMINNFAVMYMQQGEYKNAHVLLQCAIQVNRNYQQVI